MRFHAQFDSDDVGGITAHRAAQPGASYMEPYTGYFVTFQGRCGGDVTLDGRDAEGVAQIRELLVNALAALDAIDPARGDRERHQIEWEPRPAVATLTPDDVTAHLVSEHGESAEDLDQLDIIADPQLFHDRQHLKNTFGHRHASYDTDAEAVRA